VRHFQPLEDLQRGRNERVVELNLQCGCKGPWQRGVHSTLRGTVRGLWGLVLGCSCRRQRAELTCGPDTMEQLEEGAKIS
jgi:hypothetical protein